jgi:hypothetical protein
MGLHLDYSYLHNDQLLYCTDFDHNDQIPNQWPLRIGLECQWYKGRNSSSNKKNLDLLVHQWLLHLGLDYIVLPEDQ